MIKEYIHIKKGKLLIVCVLFIAVVFLILPVVKFNDPTSTILEDREGNLLAAKIADDGQWRFPDCDSVPRKLSIAIRMFEDEYFYYHLGINPVSLFRALKQNIKEGRIVSGGSTISMQVVRIFRKGKPRTVGEKLKEIFLAFKLELTRSKEDILKLYVSHAPFGGNVVGIDAASWRYYGRPANSLSWGEAATLAVLPNAPSLVYPGKNQDLLIKKRNRLLDKLLSKGLLDNTSCELAKSETLPLRPAPLPQITPHLLDRAIKDGHKGRKIVTSIRQDLQLQVNQLVESHYQTFVQNEIHNMAVLILDVHSRKVITYVGNTGTKKEGSGGQVDVITAPRSSGSILKPFLFASMLDEGEILPNSLIPDIPTHISDYAPKNFDRTYSGAVPASQMLVRSLNVPAVRMLQEYGVEKFYSKLQKLGFSSINRGPDNYGLTLILGGAEVTLWDLGKSYSGMAATLNHFEEYEYRYDPEEYYEPSYFADFSNSGKESSVKKALLKNGLYSSAAIWSTLNTLTDLKRPIEEGLWEFYASTKNIAWKTGTSFGFRDAWAVGVSPQYFVGVWVGNADGEGRPGLTGLNAAAPVLFDVFNLLPAGEWFRAPYDEMVDLAVCHESGYRAGPDCEIVDTLEVLVNGTKVRVCPYHIKIHLDKDETYLVNSDCYPVAEMVEKYWFVLPPAMAWYYKRKNPAYMDLPPIFPKCRSGTGQLMEIIYPRETKQVFIPRNLDGSLSNLVFEAAHSISGTPIYWHLDDEYLGETNSFHQMELKPAPGWHTLVLIDASGNILEKSFEVVE